MKKILSAIFSFMAVVLLVCAGMLYFSNLTERKESNNKFSDFYRQEEDYDVLFLGSSHVLNGIFPMELWSDYGIVSYNLASHGSRPASNYWILKNALEYTKPKLVVVDCCMISQEEKVGSIEQLHMSTDHIPFGKTKVEMIRDLVEDEKQHGEFLWEFSMYHNRWNELEENDFSFQPSPEKGAETRIGVAIPDETVIFDASYKMEEETVGTEYLRRIIEECQQQGIEALLTYIPFPDKHGYQKEVNSVWDIAKEYDVNYLDYYTLMDQVNFNIDCYDANSHLNPSGARKITSHIGSYITGVYGIEDHREDEAYSQWHEDYETYVEFKKENIKKEEELKNYLMLLRDKSFSYGVYLKWGFDWNAYPVIKELLLNMGVNPDMVVENGDCFLFVDTMNQTQDSITMLETMDSSFGEFSLVYNEDGELELSCKEGQPMIITHNDIAVVVFDNSTLSLVDQAIFEIDQADVNMTRQKN